MTCIPPASAPWEDRRSEDGLKGNRATAKGSHRTPGAANRLELEEAATLHDRINELRAQQIYEAYAGERPAATPRP